MENTSTQITRNVKANEIEAVTQQVVEATAEGIEACDSLDVLISVADKCIKVSDSFRAKRNYAKRQLTDLAMRI